MRNNYFYIILVMIIFFSPIISGLGNENVESVVDIKKLDKISSNNWEWCWLADVDVWSDGTEVTAICDVEKIKYGNFDVGIDGKTIKFNVSYSIEVKGMQDTGGFMWTINDESYGMEVGNVAEGNLTYTMDCYDGDIIVWTVTANLFDPGFNVQLRTKSVAGTIFCPKININSYNFYFLLKFFENYGLNNFLAKDIIIDKGIIRCT